MSSLTHPQPIEVFFSYSQEDEQFRAELVKHLSSLKRERVITEWHARKITPGHEWAGEINAHLNSAQIILLLISADFLASDYCFDVELTRAMERHRLGEAVVIPVILRPVDWQGAPFQNLKVLPSNANPITMWSDRDEAFEDVAKGIRAVVAELASGDQRNHSPERRRKNHNVTILGISLILIGVLIALNMYQPAPQVVQSLPATQQATAQLTAFSQSASWQPSAAASASTSTLVSPVASASLPQNTETILADSSNPNVDVLIAKFENSGATQTLEIARRLEENLQLQLQQNNLSDVTVEAMPEVIANDMEAKAIAHKTQSKAIIWGWYDDAGISVRLLLAQEQLQSAGLAGLSDIPLDSGSEQLALTIRRSISPNVTFMSLFVIGHLKYVSNDSEAGLSAFDAAMMNIPEDVRLDNEAVLHFFNARLLERTNNNDTEGIICEYTKAIKLDSNLAEAYNNLGVAIYRYPGLNLPEKASTCLAEIGLDGIEDTSSLFERALEKNPQWAVPKYNLLASKWDIFDSHPQINQEVKVGLQEIIQADPLILGAYIVLGYIAIEEQDFESAIKHFSEATELDPQSAKLHVNLGQAYALAHLDDEADDAFSKALQIDPSDLEARLGAANLALKKKQHDTADTYLDFLTSLSQRDAFQDTPAAMAVILRSRALFDKGDSAQAIKTLEEFISFVRNTPPDEYDQKPTPSSFITYLVSLLSVESGDTQKASQYWPSLEEDNPTEGELFVGDVYARNQTSYLTWYDIVRKCYSPQSTDVSEWGSATNNCLPLDTKERITAVYDIFQSQLWYRLDYTKMSMIGLMCPYVFTYDPESQMWLRDTTILYGLVGPEAETVQARRLTRFDGRLVVREVEPETSYIDQIYILIVDEDHREIKLQPQLAVLQDADNDYLRLKQGHQVLLEFQGYTSIPNIWQVWVVAKGYYIPLPYAMK